ncbi:MAG TPA: EAL domain-containing protein [Rhodanobacteraceae bacterium]|nr:EAL domain-containing protein [Rhodanobacteraceae bacterium]
MMPESKRPVLVMASSREDRRVLFDALDGIDSGEILSARDAIHARALLRNVSRPALAILDFEHAPTQSRMLCAELAGVPVIGLFGAGFNAQDTGKQPAGDSGIKAWLRMPVDSTEAAVRIREALQGAAPAALPAARGAVEMAAAAPRQQQDDPAATLRAIADLMQPGRDAVGLPGLVQRVMQTFGLDLMVIAEKTSASGEALRLLARVDRMSAPGAPDPLAREFVRPALDGEAVIRVGNTNASDDAFMKATGCACHAALPLFDTHRNVVGVMECASLRASEVAGPMLQSMLEIVAARFAMLLELRAEHQRGRSRALLDGLTGLPNRMLFNDRLESTLHDARRTGEVFAVLFVDLDGFKDINDSLGHAIGDRVLAASARRLREAVRASDTVARYAGDEFTLIVRHLNDRAGIRHVAAKLLQGMQGALTLEDGSELQVTASIGVSVYPDDAADAEGLIKHADMAMYSAKGRGRNNVQAFGNVPEDAHRQRLEMESRLRKAEANGELSVHYQPQIELGSEDIIGVEALVRWKHPTLGMLSPAFFVPLAEETGLIISIGEWVLRRACTDVAVWQRSCGKPLRLAVNLSALQWMQPNLVAMIESACRDARLEPSMLDLETSESVLQNPGTELATVLRTLRRIGCRVVIGDAGAGQIASGQAAHLPVDSVKVDHSFVRNIGSDPDDEAVVASILGVARGQGRRTIAAGVETEPQLEFLRGRGCEVAQGYLFCRPLAAGAFTDLLAARHVEPTGDHSHALLRATGATDNVVPLSSDRQHGAAG